MTFKTSAMLLAAAVLAAGAGISAASADELSLDWPADWNASESRLAHDRGETAVQGDGLIDFGESRLDGPREADDRHGPETQGEGVLSDLGLEELRLEWPADWNPEAPRRAHDRG